MAMSLYLGQSDKSGDQLPGDIPLMMSDTKLRVRQVMRYEIDKVKVSLRVGGSGVWVGRGDSGTGRK